jgi:hypothetical protein
VNDVIENIKTNCHMSKVRGASLPWPKEALCFFALRPCRGYRGRAWQPTQPRYPLLRERGHETELEHEPAGFRDREDSGLVLAVL